GAADELGRGDVSGAEDVGHLVVTFVENAGVVHPPEDVAAAIGARHAHELAAGEHDPPSTARYLVRQLSARGRRSDDEHTVVALKLLRGAVVERGDLPNVRGGGLG